MRADALAAAYHRQERWILTRKFSPSAYLQFLPRSDGWAVYHALFGNLSLIDQAGKDLIKAFAGSAAINETSRKLPPYAPSALRSYANDLVIRGFLVPTGCDEYCLVEENETVRKERLQSGYLVRALQLVLDKRCNYRCAYCFMDFEPMARGIAVAQGSMSAEIAQTSMRQLIALLKRNGNDVLNVEFFGGEPLMNWPVIHHILATFGNEYDGVSILYSITTNGALITREMADMFRRYSVTVTVSLDLAGPVDGLPRAIAKNGERIRRQLGILRDQGNAVTFNSVISKETIDHFDGRKLTDFAAEYNVAMVGLILDLDLVFYRDPRNRERATRILMDTYRHGREIGVPVGGYWYLIFGQIAGKQAINLRSGYKTCPATGCKVSVEPDGSIFTCECTNGKIGHISDLDAVLASDTYAEYAMRAYRHAPECAGCEIEGFCSGVCVGSLENAYQRRDMVEAGACEIFRKITRDLIVDASRAEISDDLRVQRYE
jgi:uncharacterized protein